MKYHYIIMYQLFIISIYPYLFHSTCRQLKRPFRLCHPGHRLLRPLSLMARTWPKNMEIRNFLNRHGLMGWNNVEHLPPQKTHVFLEEFEKGKSVELHELELKLPGLGWSVYICGPVRHDWLFRLNRKIAHHESLKYSSHDPLPKASKYKIPTGIACFVLLSTWK